MEDPGQQSPRRRRIPFWAVPVLAGMPLWGYVFVQTLEPAPVEDDPLVLGEHLYASCAGCHGPTGGGSGGPAFTGQAVVKTFPDPLDQMMWVRLGNQAWPSDTYGAQSKPVDRSRVMPAHPELSDQELAQVVLYERRALAGEEPPPVDEDVLLQIATGQTTFAEAVP